MSTGYKVLKQLSENLFCPATTAALQSFRYSIGKSTKRDREVSGPMAVFNDLDAALSFTRILATFGLVQLHILKVKYIESSPHEQFLWRMRTKNDLTPNKINDVANPALVIKFIDKCPPGTKFAEEVTPIEIVDIINLELQY